MKPFIWHAFALAMSVAHPLVAQETYHSSPPSSCASKAPVSNVCISDLKANLVLAQKNSSEAMLIADALNKEYRTLAKKADRKNANAKLAEVAILVAKKLSELKENNAIVENNLQKAQESLRNLKARQSDDAPDFASAIKKATAVELANEKVLCDKKTLETEIAAVAKAKTDDERRKALQAVHDANKELSKSKKEAEDAAKEILKIADMVQSTTTEYDLAVITNAVQDAHDKLIQARQNGNDVMIQAEMAVHPNAVAQMPTAQVSQAVEKRRQFLTALEAHPLFISSLSGSGASFSVNGQSDKITLRQTVKRSWDKAHNFSVAIGLNKTDDVDNKTVTRLDGFDSDWSIQGSYSYLGLLRNSQNDAHDIFGFAGVDVAKGRETVSYLDPAISFADPAKIAKLSASNMPWSVAAHAGFALDNYAVRYKLMHKHGWDVNPKSTVCPAMPTNGHFTCTNIPVGVPDRKVFNVSAIDFRMSFKNWAFSPAFRYDHATRIKELVLPVHLPIFNAGNGKNLTAGLVPSWRSDDRWHLGIFAGSSFDLGLSD